MKNKVVPSTISAHQKLDSFMMQKGLSSVDMGVVLDSVETSSLSSYLKSASPNYTRKLYPCNDETNEGRCVCGRIDKNGNEAWACLFPRVDKTEIDFDLAVWDCGNQLSTIYHPSFENRTSPSADVAKELDDIDDIYKKGSFEISSLCDIAPTVYAAFQYCKRC